MKEDGDNYKEEMPKEKKKYGKRKPKLSVHKQHVDKDVISRITATRKIKNRKDPLRYHSKSKFIYYPYINLGHNHFHTVCTFAIFFRSKMEFSIFIFEMCMKVVKIINHVTRQKCHKCEYESCTKNSALDFEPS